MKFIGKCKNFGGKCLKKVIKIFRGKFVPLVSEVLDPLVSPRHTVRMRYLSHRQPDAETLGIDAENRLLTAVNQHHCHCLRPSFSPFTTWRGFRPRPMTFLCHSLRTIRAIYRTIRAMSARRNVSREVQTQRLVKGWRAYLSSVYLCNNNTCCSISLCRKESDVSLRQTLCTDSVLQKPEKQNPGRCRCTTLHLPAGAPVHHWWHSPRTTGAC